MSDVEKPSILLDWNQVWKSFRRRYGKNVVWDFGRFEGGSPTKLHASALGAVPGGVDVRTGPETPEDRAEIRNYLAVRQERLAQCHKAYSLMPLKVGAVKA